MWKHERVNESFRLLKNVNKIYAFLNLILRVNRGNVCFHEWRTDTVAFCCDPPFVETPQREKLCDEDYGKPMVTDE
jgi:hypothetical protein